MAISLEHRGKMVCPAWKSYTAACLHDGKDAMADFTPTQGRDLVFIHAYTNLHV
jgi:hypothetical protein